jgi:glycosyltransferase involved in cell wall biosynthesis
VLSIYPGVSVIMPVRNEGRHLAAAVAHILDQHYPGPLQVIMAVGPSTDRTGAVAAGLATTDERLQVVDNPHGRTPNALNLAIAAARHDIVARVDGHGELTTGYLRRAVELLDETGAANVGGVMDAQGQTPFEQTVAYAYGTRLGLGGSKFHLENSPAGPADTVFLGVFRKQALADAGGFDETMHRAQDWELNYRLRSRGELIWFSPELKVTYRPRPTLGSLMSQFYRTGQWRREVIRRHADTVSLRYLAPPLTVLGIATGGIAGSAGSALGKSILKIGWLAPLGYTLLILAGSLTARDISKPVRARLPVVLVAMHLAWGLGFLVGVDSRMPGSRTLDQHVASARQANNGA